MRKQAHPVFLANRPQFTTQRQCPGSGVSALQRTLSAGQGFGRIGRWRGSCRKSDATVCSFWSFQGTWEALEQVVRCLYPPAARKRVLESKTPWGEQFWTCDWSMRNDQAHRMRGIWRCSYFKFALEPPRCLPGRGSGL